MLELVVHVKVVDDLFSAIVVVQVRLAFGGQSCPRRGRGLELSNLLAREADVMVVVCVLADVVVVVLVDVEVKSRLATLSEGQRRLDVEGSEGERWRDVGCTR